jgi:phosphate starvation-inducible PhoH-like protein
VEGIARIVFRDVDVVRHDLVRRIVTAYDADTAASVSPRGEARGS